METTPQFFRHGPSPLARLVFFVLLSLILMAVDTHFKYLHEIRQTVAVVIYPVQRLSYLPTTIYDLVSELFVTQNLADEIAHLKQQHLVDSGQLQQLLALRAENEHLRKLLETTPRNKSKAIMAEILSVPRDPFNLKIMLDKGFQNGIQSGQVVVDDLGVVGQITRSYPWHSEVTLITDKDHSVPVQVLRNGLRSVASGTGKYRTLELRYMANNIDIESGDVLVTSGIDGVYPSGLPVALVSKIKRNNASHAFAQIACTPIAGVDRNKQVLILSPRLPSPENLTGSESTDIQPNDKERKEIGVR
ncbi:MAG: rod shape-determining protein MreC [Nitrosomonadaceae bacterium]